MKEKLKSVDLEVKERERRKFGLKEKRRRISSVAWAEDERRIG